MATDLYRDCQHCWHVARQEEVWLPESGTIHYADETCCHCGVHRIVRLDWDGKRKHGKYVPPMPVSIDEDGTVTLSGPVLHFPSIE